MLRIENSPFGNFILGLICTVAGLLIVIFHRSIKERRDWWASRDFPVGYGDFWTGKYTRGGLIATYILIILFGVIIFAVGVLTIIKAFTE